MRILFTGGSGKAGRVVVRYLMEQGHRVLNVDKVPLDLPGLDNLNADITDSGQMFNALSAYAGFDELEPGTGVPEFDAVVHFAAVPRILMAPDNETYRVNVMGTYNVMEAATKLGIRKIIFASSETTYGICFADGMRKPEYIPLDEEHPVVPEDSYAMSKVVNEVTGRSFHQRTGADIYGIRINNVIAPEQYETDFPTWLVNPDMRRRNFFAYIDARDLGQIVDLCLQKDGLGFQIFNASNDDHSVAMTTSDLIERYYADVPLKRQMGPEETFYSNRKAQEMLGFRQQHSWRNYVDDPRN